MKLMKHSLYFVTIFLLLATLSGCAAFEKIGHKKSDGKKDGEAKVQTVKNPQGREIPIEVKKPETENPEIAAVTPQRQASLQVVAQGKQLLSQRQLEQALQRFQDAANIDGSNGIAYYYVARAQFELGNYAQAQGVLDRAEALLADYPDWIASVHALRNAVNEANKNSNPT